MSLFYFVCFVSKLKGAITLIYYRQNQGGLCEPTKSQRYTVTFVSKETMLSLSTSSLSFTKNLRRGQGPKQKKPFSWSLRFVGLIQSLWVMGLSLFPVNGSLFRACAIHLSPSVPLLLGSFPCLCHLRSNAP